MNVLERVLETANSIPPVDNKASRFGNPAFRTFYDKVQEVRLSPICCYTLRRQSPVLICTHFLVNSLLQSCTTLFLAFRTPQFPNSVCISWSHGVTARVSTMEAAWSSTSSVGCEPPPRPPVRFAHPLTTPARQDLPRAPRRGTGERPRRARHEGLLAVSADSDSRRR